METIQLGNTDIVASRIGLGTWAMGGWMWGGSDEQQAIATIQAAIDKGITLIDTAPVYGFGRSEEIVGKALAGGGRRARAVIATKVALEWRDGKVFRNSTRARIRRAIDVSNYSPAQMEVFQRIAPLHTVQPPYNLFERGVETDVLPYARSAGVTVLAYGALCRGLLSGKITENTRFEGDDLRNVDPKF